MIEINLFLAQNAIMILNKQKILACLVSIIIFSPCYQDMARKLLQSDLNLIKPQRTDSKIYQFNKLKK